MKKLLLYCASYVVLTTNLFSQSLNFDGTNDYISTSTLLSSSTYTNFTLECWVKSPTAPNATGYTGPIYEDNMGIVWDHVTPAFRGAAFIRTGSSTYLSTSFGPLAANTWYHLAVTYNGASLTTYKNGTKVNSTPVTGSVYNSAVPFYIGLSSQNQVFKGNIDDVRVWNVARTCNEINSSMNIELVGNETGLTNYYKLNDGSAGLNNTSLSGILNTASNNIDGIFNNFALNNIGSNFDNSAPFNATINCICPTLLSLAVPTGDTLRCNGGSNYRTAVAFNPVHQLYYSVEAGGTAPDEIFDINGNKIGSSIAADWRGLWWNENNQTIEGNTWGSFLAKDALLANGYLGGTIATLGSTSPPNNQAVGAYSADNNIIYYYFNGVLYGESHNTFADITPVALTGIASFTNVLSPTLFYYNCAGKEIVLFDNNSSARRLLFFNKNTGALSATVDIPTSAGPISNTSGNFSYANNKLWLYNHSIYKWVAYNFNGAIPTGINKLDEKKFAVYPNPATSILNIEVKEQTQISIVNILGEIVKTQIIEKNTSVDVSNLNNGIYFIQDLKSGTAIKFIKE